MANPWDVHIDSLKANGVQMCGIYGNDGYPWAASADAKATPQEITNILAAIKSQNFSNGIHFGGVKYTVINSSPDGITAKCRGAANPDQNWLMQIARCNTCLVVGAMCGAAERDVTKKVADYQDYLMRSNY